MRPSWLSCHGLGYSFWFLQSFKARKISVSLDTPDTQTKYACTELKSNLTLSRRHSKKELPKFVMANIATLGLKLIPSG